jgi:hypothetical protein
MTKLFYLILLIVLTLYLLVNCNKTENMINDISTSILNNMAFDQIKNTFVNIPKIKSLKPGETIEILDLPYCKEEFLVRYTSNTNNIINDNTKIYQDMIKPYDQKALIGDKAQNLVQISWNKSVFTWDGKKVPLELHFSHTDPKTGKLIRIIFPLSLINITESFSNTNNQLSKLESTSKLDLLLKKEEDVPEIVANKVNIGKILNFDLCRPAQLIIQQKNFFFVRTPSDELILIAKPQNFDFKIGKKIIDNLQEPNYFI